MLHTDIKVDDVGLELSCSWEVANKKCINDTVTVDSNFKRGKKEDLENIVSLDTCVHLINQNVTSCYLKLKLSVVKAWQIKKVSIVSEARIIEIYGKCEEYLTTCHAEFFDECEDMSVYIAEAELPQPSSECTLKFARLKRTDQMWLYGIHITVDKAESFISQDMSINFHNVNRILKDSGHQLTEKAERCKKFLQLYGSLLDSSKTQLKGPDPQMLRKMFESEYLGQQNTLSSRAKSVSKCLTEMLPGFSVPTKEKSGNEDEAISTHKTGCSKETDVSLKLTHIVDILKHHFDERFSEYERQITVRVEEKLMELERKQNEKLDLILERLEELKKSVVIIRGPEG